jgi:hypothetical protein
MANGKHISQDELQFIVDVESSKAQQEIHKLEKESSRLRSENKQRLNQMIQLEAQGKKNTSGYKALQKEYKDTGNKIRDLTAKIGEQTSKLKVNYFTMSQLKKQAKQLQKELDNTVKSLHPEEYTKLEERLKAVKERMTELKSDAKSYKETLKGDDVRNYIFGTGFVKMAELAGSKMKELKDRMFEFVSEGVEMAEQVDGISHAFNQLDQHQKILENLRKSTKGTVNDMELMKAAVQAKDFRIPLEDLGKYLAFAQLKAQQTGQSVDYMTNSIVTGLGRKSKLILDNLGISASEIDEKVAETGDFMKAVASIVDNQLKEAGGNYVSAADRALKKTTDLQNAQLALGQAVLPYKEAWEDVTGTVKVSILQLTAYLLSHRKVLLAVSVATTGFTVAMTALNLQFRNWIKTTALAKVATAGWATVTTTVKGFRLLAIAMLNSHKNATRAAAAMRLFNNTCKANVYVAAASAIIGISIALYTLLKRNKETSQSTIDFMKLHKKLTEDIKAQNNDLKKSANDSISDRITKIKSLRNTINDASQAYSKRKAAIQDLQKLVPGYHASIDGEGKLFAQNTKIINTYIGKLRQAAMAEAAYEKIKENNRKILDAQDRIDDSNRKISAVRRNSRSKYGMDFDKMHMDEDGYVRYNDVHRDDDPRLLDRTKMDYKWDAVAAKDNIRANQAFLEKKGELVRSDKALVDAYSAQNERLWAIVKKNGGSGQAILNPTFINNTTHKKGSAADTVGKEQKEEFSNARNEELEQQQKLYDQAQEALKQNLIQRKMTQEEYNQQVLSLEMANAAKVYQIEQSYTEKARNLKIKDANSAKKILVDQQSNEENARRKFEEKNLDAMKQYYDAMEKLQEMGLTPEQKQEADYNMQLESLEAYYKASLDYAKAHGEDILAVTAAYEQAKANIIKKYADQKAQEQLQAREKYGLVSDSEQQARDLEAIKEDYDKGLLTHEQYEQAVSNKENEYAEKRKQQRIQLGVERQSEYQRQLAQLKAALAQGIISHEEYEERVKQIKFDHWKEEFDRYQQLFGGAVSALQDAEMANVDAKYDAEIEAARQAGKDTTDIENKKANEKLKIQKKYADVNFAIKASEIIASTAGAIMEALEQLGPIAGPVAAALMGVTGAAQLAAANAERQKVKRMTLNGSSSSSTTSGARVATGLESGGSIDVEREQDGKRFHASYDPSKRGYIDRPTVIVGEGPAGRSKEWVASNAALDNPTVAPLIDIIDRAQRAGQISTLDMRKYLMQRQVRGLASGGSATVAQPTMVTAPSNTADRSQLAEKLYAVLSDLRNNGIPAYVALDEFDAKQKMRDQARRIGSKL